MSAKKNPENTRSRTAVHATPPKAPWDLVRYELDLRKREEETRAPAPITQEETTELLAVASKLRQGGDSPLVFLRRALDAQQRLRQDPAVAAAKTWDEGVKAICQLLEKPNERPDVIFSPRLLNRLREFRLGAARPFAAESFPQPFDPEKEFGWVSMVADYHADTSPFLEKLSRAIGVPRTKAHTAAKRNAKAHEFRVYQWTLRLLKSVLKKARATSKTAAQELIEGELKAAGVPTDLCPRLAARALESREGGESLNTLLGLWLMDLQKSLIQAAYRRELTEHARSQATARTASLSDLAERRRQHPVRLTAEQVTDKALGIVADERELEGTQRSKARRHVLSLEKMFTRPK